MLEGATINPLALAKAAPWRSVLFTTYALSLSFFEAVVIDALIRGRARSPTILADPAGVRAGLSERGARLVGRDYELLPTERIGGVFHPKLSVFLGDDDAHLLVGSGNLTFGGWGGNLELIEHLHPSFAPDAIIEAADFLELLAIDDRMKLPKAESLGETADRLRSSAQGKSGSGRIRFVHNAAGSIAERIQQEAAELGGAERICCISPFFDRQGTGISRLGELLGCEDISGYAHQAGAVRGLAGTNWPDPNSKAINPVVVEHEFAGDPRLLHAKTIEVVCRSGRLVLSGSANATNAGLFGANMEAGVLRIEPDRQGAWSLVSCPTPAHFANEDLETETEHSVEEILCAELVGAIVKGEVLTKWSSGPAVITCEIEGEMIDLGTVDVDDRGCFAQRAEQLGDRIWSRGRVIIELQADDQVARGFLMVTAVAQLVQRAGPAATRMLSVLAGTETPEDVAAIMAWFQEDPSRMPGALARDFGHSSGAHRERDDIVTSEALDRANFIENSHGKSDERTVGWQSAMAALFKAFRSNRGPLGSQSLAKEETDGDQFTAEESEDLKRDERSNERAIDSFSKLLDTALSSQNQGKYAEAMLSIAHYLVDRIRPPNDRVNVWLEKILRSLPQKVAGDLARDIVTLQILRVANLPTCDIARKARRLLRKTGLLDDLEASATDRLPAFHSYIPAAISLEQAKELILRVRTHREEIHTLLTTSPEQPLPKLPLLECTENWSRLLRAREDPDLRERLQFVDAPVSACPQCHMGLPTGNRQELLETGLTRCTNRCGRLIILSEA
jgi:hypothetical protein